MNNDLSSGRTNKNPTEMYECTSPAGARKDTGRNSVRIIPKEQVLVKDFYMESGRDERPRVEQTLMTAQFRSCAFWPLP